MHSKPLSVLFSLALTCSFAAGVILSYDPAYDNSAASINAVACSDGPNGLGTRGYQKFGSLPSFPNIGGAPAVEGWNSVNCGSCWKLTYGNGNGHALYMLAVDRGAGFVTSLEAMNTLTNGSAVNLGTTNVTAQRVNSSNCGL
ncbi:immunomodulatory protein [Amanita rubescens]|nr:immunomodulatory protein [Amanita rubescens]